MNQKVVLKAGILPQNCLALGVFQVGFPYFYIIPCTQIQNKCKMNKTNNDPKLAKQVQSGSLPDISRVKYLHL